MPKNYQRTVQIFLSYTHKHSNLLLVILLESLSICITNKKEGNNIYWDFSPKKYYGIKEVRIYSTITIIIKDIKMKFNILTLKILPKIGKTINGHFVLHSV